MKALLTVALIAVAASAASSVVPPAQKAGSINAEPVCKAISTDDADANLREADYMFIKQYNCHKDSTCGGDECEFVDSVITHKCLQLGDSTTQFFEAKCNGTVTYSYFDNADCKGRPTSVVYEPTKSCDLDTAGDYRLNTCYTPCKKN